MCRKACLAVLDCMWLRLPLPTHIRIPASSCMRVPEYVAGSGRTAPLLTPAALVPLDHQSTLDLHKRELEQASSTGAKLPSHEYQPCLEADGSRSHISTTAHRLDRFWTAFPWSPPKASLKDRRSFVARHSPLCSFSSRAASALGLVPRSILPTPTTALQGPLQDGASSASRQERRKGELQPPRAYEAFPRTLSPLAPPSANPDPFPPPQ